MLQISRILSDLHQRFKPVSDSPLLDAQVLVAFILGQPRSWLLAHQEILVSATQLETIDHYSDRIISGEPLPYILGKWEFYGLEFKITRDTLIPRPETELLVEHALSCSESRNGDMLIVDIGTGSGCIAIALAANLPGLRIVAGDISLPALLIARENARKHHVEKRVLFLLCDLLPPLVDRFDVLCANLPYIPSSRLQSSKPARWEPKLSLNGGPDGLSLVSRLLNASIGRMSRNGLILLEIDADAGRSALTIARECYPDAEINLVTDLAGHNRMLRIQLQ